MFTTGESGCRPCLLRGLAGQQPVTSVLLRVQSGLLEDGLRQACVHAEVPSQINRVGSILTAFSPRSKESLGLGFSAVVVARFKMFWTSSSVSGEGV